MSQRFRVVIIAGIAGVGKTTVGRLLAADLGWVVKVMTSTRLGTSRKRWQECP